MDNHLLRFQPEKKYLLFDFESEHLSLIHKNRPWNAGFLVWQNGKTLEEHEMFIDWPDFNISKGAARVTRFDYNKYNKLKKNNKECLEKFESYLYNDEYLIIGHNLLKFDIFLYSIWRKELGMKPNYSFLTRLLDTDALIKAFKLGMKTVPIDPIERLAFQYRFAHYVQKGLKSNLTLSGKERNIPFDYESVHQGLQDVRLNALVWEKLILEMEI